MSLPEFQHKPSPKPNYQERVRLGLQRGRIKKKSDKQKDRDRLEQEQHNKNIANEKVFCVNCGSNEHLSKHHYKGRAFPGEFIYLCTMYGCKKHDWIHDNPNEAFKLGWIFAEYRGLPPNQNQTIPWKK